MSGFEPSSMQQATISASLSVFGWFGVRPQLAFFFCFVLLVTHTFSASDRRLGPLRDVDAANLESN